MSECVCVCVLLADDRALFSSRLSIFRPYLLSTSQLRPFVLLEIPVPVFLHEHGEISDICTLNFHSQLDPVSLSI